MKKLTKRWQMILYGCAGLGLNMLNIIIGTKLCNGLIINAFGKDDIGIWTYETKTIVVVGAWMALSFIVKIFDGLVDIPLSTFTDNLRTRWGRRRPAILIGLIPTVISFVLFLFPLENAESSWLNTVWFVLMLAVFYASYTLTMVTYYATFSEIVDNEHDRNFISTVKSICDVVYFSLNFALVPVFISMGINVRYVALMFLPLALTMLIPLFLIKEKSTREGECDDEMINKQERVGFLTSIKFSFKNKRFIYWLCIVAVMNVGLQLFLGGIDPFFSWLNYDIPDNYKINMTFVMASAFAPVPFTLILYNKILKKRGLGFAFRYILLTFSIGMSLMMLCHVAPVELKLPLAIGCAIVVSFAIGAFFSITYTVPAQLAAEENETGTVCASTMYFAVQGLFEAISASLATQVFLIAIRMIGGGVKDASGEITQEGALMDFFPLFVAGFCMLAFLMTYFLPRSISRLGKINKSEEDLQPDDIKAEATVNE